jgi:hypothetical protein
MLVGRRPSDVAIQSAKETKAGRVEVTMNFLKLTLSVICKYSTCAFPWSVPRYPQSEINHQTYLDIWLKFEWQNKKKQATKENN